MAAVTRREYVGGAAETTLASDITNSSTSITLDDATNWPTGANPFFIVIDEGTSSEEKILCSARSSNTVTASSRGADDTSATAHDAGATVKHVWTAQDADDANKVAAALTTKGDLLGFSTEPTRVPVGADDTIPVADSSDAEGLTFKGLHELLGTWEVDGSTEVASQALTTSYANVASVALSIPAGWGSWKCYAYATYLTSAGASGDLYNAKIVIDGTDQQVQVGVGAEADAGTSNPGSIAGRRTGIGTSGSRTIALQAEVSEADDDVTFMDVFLYARAVRTS